MLYSRNCHIIINQLSFNNNKKIRGFPIVAQCGTKPTSIHEGESLIPGLAQWVKDLVVHRCGLDPMFP